MLEHQERWEQPAVVPTILMVDSGANWVEPLTEGLEELGCLVLRATDGIEALLVTQVHSRPIHIVVLDGDAQNRALAQTLRAYRARMAPVFVSAKPIKALADECPAETVLAKIAQILKRPTARATHA
jgi:hypothetical protein